MGEVYFARQIHLGTPAAIKALSPSLTGHSRFRERFLNEARSQARLNHPHIAQLLDYIEQNGHFFLVLEYINGGTLADVMDNRPGPVDISQALMWTRQSLYALDYAHQNRIIHRDIKPSNIMLDQYGNVKVCDFGIAITIGKDRMTTGGQSIGTPGYMSPEQIMHPLQIDHRTDVYSMGAVLYELLTGRAPFNAMATFVLRKAHVEETAVSPRLHNPAIHPILEEIVLRALAKSPDDRFHGCGDFARAIEAYEHTTSNAAPAPGPPPPETPSPPYPQQASPVMKPAHERSPFRITARLASFGLSKQWLIAAAAVLLTGLSGMIFIIWIGSSLWNDGEISNKNSRGAGEQVAGSAIRADQIEFVSIQPGDFDMGSSMGETDEKPVRHVHISRPFEIGKFEVTQFQWEFIMGSNPSRFRGPDRPVENISWNDTQEFISRLNAHDGRYNYRLPTEAEWEYACRAGGGGSTEVSWSNNNSDGETHRVGSKNPNAWGLHDMLGNAWEWVQDWYDSSYSPTDTLDPQGPSTGSYKVNRGGSWTNPIAACRPSIRGYDSSTSRGGHIGFRLVRTKR